MTATRHIRQVLTELQEIIGTAHDDPKRKFGDLYDRLARDLTSEDYAPFRDLVRSHIAESWPMGPGMMGPGMGPGVGPGDTGPNGPGSMRPAMGRRGQSNEPDVNDDKRPPVPPSDSLSIR